MEKEYIVGIDFGHGETAAWMVPMPNITTMNKEGDSLRLRNSDKVQNRTIWSRLYNYSDGTFSLTLKSDTPPALLSKLKNKICELSKDKERLLGYKEYARLIVGKLLELNTELKWEQGEANFYLCMANPTRWSDKEKEEYLSFFNAALADDDFSKDGLHLRGLKFTWIINESDAAFFSQCYNDKNLTGVVLVIDYGSSTIDYTLMKNGMKVSDDEWSNQQLGASIIEKEILQVYRDKDVEKYEQTLLNVINLLEKTKNQHIDPTAWLDDHSRKQKEDTYAEQDPDVAIKYNFEKLTHNSQFREFRFESDYMPIKEITKSYVESVVKDFKTLKNKIEKAGIYKVDRIILSGGACIMPWVSKEVKEIFENSQIISDRYPSYVVAKGIALYAQAQQEALDELETEIKKIDFGQLYKEADIFATREAIKQFAPEIVNEVKNSPTNYTGDQIRSNFCNFIDGLNGSNADYSFLVQKNIDDAVTKKVQDIVHNAIKRIFHKEVSTTQIQVNLSVTVYNWGEGCFAPGGCWYESFTKWIPDYCFTFFSFDWSVNRNKEKRAKIAEGIYSLLCSQEKTAFLEEMSYSNIDDLAKEIQNQALEAAKDLFYEEQIFKTTFCKN